MFILSDKPVGVWWPVRWDGYDADGEDIVIEIEMRFLRIGRERTAEIYQMLNDAATAREKAENPDPKVMMIGEPAVDLAYIRDIADDWRGVGVEGPGGKQVSAPFDDATLKAMIDLPGFMGGVQRAHMEFIRGEKDIRRGNSKPSPDGGRATDPETSRPTTPRAAKRSKKS